MAILQGFPPSNTISPSVRITENDLSFIAPEQTFHRAGLIGFASKGPINVPQLISTHRQLTTVFGNPHPDVGDPYLIYAGQQYLLVASELYVVRVANVDPVDDEQAVTASVEVPAAGQVVDVFSATAGPYSFDDDSFFRFRLNGELNNKTLLVLSDANRPSPDAGDPWSTTDLVAELNSQIDSENDGIIFYVTDDDTIGVKTVWSYGPDASLEFVSVQDSIYGATGVTGLGTGMTVASTTGANAQYGNGSVSIPGTYNFTGLTGLNLQVVVDGTDNVLIDQVVQVIDLAALEGASNVIADIVTEVTTQIAGLPGGFECVATSNSLTLRTLHSGRDARLLVKSDSTADALFGFDNLTAVGDSPTMVTGDSGIEAAGIVDGEENTDNDISFTVYADSPGIEGNTTVITVANDIRQGTWIMAVANNGVVVESWGNLTKNTASRFYVETFMSLVSDYIRVVDNTDVLAPPANNSTTGYALTGGKDGIPSDPDDQDVLLVGSPVNYTGMFALSDPEQVEIDLIACPGHASTTVVTGLLDVAQNYRQDCLAIIDPPFGLTVKEIVAWQNGSHPLNLTRFNSDFGALYWPWCKMRDTFNAVDVWVPPSGSVMAAIARSDSLSAPWYAPAGLTRGIVPGITDVFSRPTLAERDLMYGNRNAINPIVQFVDVDGFVIWGQKTLQRNPTALDRINVRRLMFTCEKQIRTVSRQLLFDPHDAQFQSKFVDLATQILREIQVGRGIHDFIIKADAELNTPDVIDRNEFRARIGIQPVRAAEFIFIEFSVHRTGDFGQNADTFN